MFTHLDSAGGFPSSPCIFSSFCSIATAAFSVSILASSFSFETSHLAALSACSFALSLSLSPDFSAYNDSAFSDADADADPARDRPSLTVPLRRTRGSATSASRVSQYVQQSSIRLLSTHTDPAARRTALSSLFSPQTSPRPQSPSESSVRLEGPTASVIVHDSRPLGHVGSALSLPHDNAEANMVDDEHHTDDIVEHLDVVGTSCPKRLAITSAV